jgi:hypothetical protein
MVLRVNALESSSEGPDVSPRTGAGVPLANTDVGTGTSDWSAPLRLSLAGPIHRHQANRFGEVAWVLD